MKNKEEIKKQLIFMISDFIATNKALKLIGLKEDTPEEYIKKKYYDFEEWLKNEI